MTADSFKFVVDQFDITNFSQVLNKDDKRLIDLANICRTFSGMRKCRTDVGSVIVYLTTRGMNQVEVEINNLNMKVDEGEIELLNELNDDIYDVVIRGFGKNSDGKPTETTWLGTLSTFLSMLDDSEVITSPGNNGFYLRSIPETIISNKSSIEYFIFACIKNCDDEFYDIADVAIFGEPKD